ncbi:MAG: glycerophosphodiester phosphodiesterase family protein [Parvibaculaceae bacterium]
MTAPATSPLRIAHRGGAGLWPENTIEAFRNAIKAGADGIELDVHLTRDKVLVVHHDESLKPAIARGKNGEWLTRPTPRIKDLTFEELQAYDVGRLRTGAGYAARYPEQEAFDGARVPSLEAVIDLVKREAGPSFVVYTELKTALLDLSQSADPVELADAAVDLIEAKDFGAQSVFVSFDWRALARAKERAPHIGNAFTTLPFYSIDPEDRSIAHDTEDSAALRAASAAGADFFAGYDWRDIKGGSFAERVLRAIAAGPSDGWFAWHGDVDEESAALARELDLAVSAWTVDAPEEMQRLVSLGIDAILTDRPDRLNAVLPGRQVMAP